MKSAATPEILGDGTIGFDDAERSLAGLVWAIAEQDEREKWASEESARQTIHRLAQGRAARQWALEAIERAMDS